VIDKNKLPQKLFSIIEEKLHGLDESINFPPPSFDMMEGEIIDFDMEKGLFKNRFPVKDEYLNPYGNMQGGFISAAIDNTIGPLSMLVAPPNFTRVMEVKYGKIVPPELAFIYITATFLEQKKRQLFFQAIVESKEGEKLASAKSTHWII
jgi:acyl-coenzyme A thioesterase PaaI-like protein